VPATAVAAWAGPPSDLADARLWALSWALLAPSPRNTQPWIAELRGPDSILMRVDPDRLLPVADGNGRQTLIAHGAFLELLALAAQAEGRRAEVTLLPDGPFLVAGPMAAVRLLADRRSAPDPLFAALPRRRSTRLAYDLEKPLKGRDGEALAKAVAGDPVVLGIAREPERVRALRELARAAFRIEQSLPRARVETTAWLRLGADEVAARRDGIAVTGRSVWWLSRLGLLSKASLAAPDSLASRMGSLQWDNLFTGTASFGWLVTADDGIPSRIAAGRAYQRLDLAAAAAGVATHPVSQALGDHPATAESRRQLETLLAVEAPARVQMLFRLGYAGPQPPSPRRPLQALLRA
jgi:hypothetical protein